MAVAGNKENKIVWVVCLDQIFYLSSFCHPDDLHAG